MATLRDEVGAPPVGRALRSTSRGWTLRPARHDVLVYARWALFLDLLFIGVYGTCNWIAAQRSDLARLYFDWELAIPFAPAMVWVYLSLFALFPLPAFALRVEELSALGRRLCFATLVSAVFFLLLPARLGFERPAAVPDHELAFDFIYLLDLPHNLVPSLHISWSGLILAALRAASPAWAQRLFELWFALICVAVVLVHQHHVLDVIGGLLVAYAAIRIVRDRKAAA
jgi:membrane-associated phospholipid phosphatase